MNSAFLTMVLALSLPAGLDEGDSVTLQDAIEFYGMEAPVEAQIGELTELRLYLEAPDPLPRDVFVFVHVEAKDQPACRTARDVQPNRKEDGSIELIAEVRVPASCEPGEAEVWAGLYSRKNHSRYQVVSEATPDDRVHAGWITLVRGKPADEVQTISPGHVDLRELLERLRPWKWWIFGLLVSVLLTIILRLQRRRLDFEWDSRQAPEPTTRRMVGIVTAAVMVPLLLSILAALDFVKDDAYISFRYAHNLAAGDGLVFNKGEYLEGFTNFLWTLLMVPFEAMGADLFQVCELLGTALSVGLLITLTLLAITFHGAQRTQAQSWGPVWLATSSSLGLWATSGLEQPLAMFLPVLGVYLLWRARDERRFYLAIVSGVVLGLGCMTRPEIHLMVVIAGLPLLWDMLKVRRLTRTAVAWAGGVLLVTAPFHAFRYVYYGSLIPNTYYVKTGGSTLVWMAGVDKLLDMFSFNLLGLLVLLAPLAFFDRKRTAEKLVAAGIAVGFMLYVVKVGVDEMRWHRLYLPALPFLVLLAALGLQNLADAATRLLGGRWSRPVVYGAVWVVVLFAAWSNFAFTYKEMNGFNGRADLSGTYHPDMGKFLTRHERPHGLAAFQDMGSTPYHAPDIDFLDFIGLVDGTVAKARHDYGLHAFVATEAHRNQAAYDAEMREYFKERSPEWTILTAYVPVNSAPRIAERYAANPREDALKGYRNNSYQFQIDQDPWFDQHYVHVRTWPRSATYYLSLFRRRDLWQQTPGEVVLDALPAGVSGPRVVFEGGLELLGAELETEATERHELFMTTWFELPGPMDRDLLFFIHVGREGYQAPYDHVPGDWLYPAERWEQGQILENRVLYQVPVNMEPGEYDVYFGAYRPSTGERLAIIEGGHDGQDRVHLGKITITAMRPLLDQLIPPHRTEVQRKYPDRIIDHGRKFF